MEVSAYTKHCLSESLHHHFPQTVPHNDRQHSTHHYSYFPHIFQLILFYWPHLKCWTWFPQGCRHTRMSHLADRFSGIRWCLVGQEYFMTFVSFNMKALHSLSMIISQWHTVLHGRILESSKVILSEHQTVHWKFKFSKFSKAMDNKYWELSDTMMIL